MPNHLSGQSSPYLLQHANNPVDWYPWGSEALSRAKTEDKPIFLSIGYAACHWCHVMENESFEDQTIAEFLNQNFISIKVDREERPDLDGIYMAAVVAMSQQGGWPMSVFLTPDLKPFFGGTYFPPVPRHGLPAFAEVIRAVQAAWAKERDQVIHVSEHILEEMQKNTVLQAQYQTALQPKILSEALGNLLSNYDWAYGGWGKAPKFPQPMLIDTLLRHGADGNREALDTALHALDAMSRGGMYDVVGGGFHRYSTDSGWLVPHFEKMLYDNAQLATTYLFAYLQSREERFRLVCEQTLDFMVREMRHVQGGFFSSIDADSAGLEGSFYTWTHEDLATVMERPAEWELVRVTYELPMEGNFESRLVLQRRKSAVRAAAELGVSLDEYAAQLQIIHQKLLEHRDQRIRPATDDKILASWNGLAIRAFANAGRYLGREDYLQTARQCAGFLLDNMINSGSLYRSWRNGKTSVPGFLEDYASIILGLLTLYQADGAISWFSAASYLTQEMLDQFQDRAGGFFDTAVSSDLPYRPKDVQDNATPSGGSLAARALLLLAAFTGNESYQTKAEQMLAVVQEGIAQYPNAFGSWLLAFDSAINSVRQIAIVWDENANDKEIDDLLKVPLRSYYPRAILTFSSLPLPDNSPALLKDRSVMNGKPTAYVCRDFTCQLPVNNPQDLKNQLG